MIARSTNAPNVFESVGTSFARYATTDTSIRADVNITKAPSTQIFDAGFVHRPSVTCATR